MTYYAYCGIQRWSPRGRPWPRGHIFKSLALALASKVKSLALASKPQSSKIALSSAQGQHYFLNSWNFVGKRQKHCRKFARTSFVFFTWSKGVAKGRGVGGPLPFPIEISPMTKCDKKAYSFFSISFFLPFFAYNSIIKNNIEDQGLRVPLNSIFASQFKRMTRRKRRVFVLKVAISGPHLAFLWT